MSCGRKYARILYGIDRSLSIFPILSFGDEDEDDFYRYQRVFYLINSYFLLENRHLTSVQQVSSGLPNGSKNRMASQVRMHPLPKLITS